MNLPHGGTVIKIDALHREVAKAIAEKGEYYFSSSKLFDAFQLEENIETKRKAIDTMLTFNKWLKKLKCEFLLVGIVARNTQEIAAYKQNPEAIIHLSFTYTIQSKRHDNQPLKIDRIFELDFPILAIPNRMAEFWLDAYKEIPEIDILQIANGR